MQHSKIQFCKPSEWDFVLLKCKKKLLPLSHGCGGWVSRGYHNIPNFNFVALSHRGIFVKIHRNFCEMPLRNFLEKACNFTKRPKGFLQNPFEDFSWNLCKGLGVKQYSTVWFFSPSENDFALVKFKKNLAFITWREGHHGYLEMTNTDFVLFWKWFFTCQISKILCIGGNFCNN